MKTLKYKLSITLSINICPYKHLFRTFCLTFNVAGYPPPVNDNAVLKLLGLDEDKFDIYAIGFQEVHSRLDKYFFDAFVRGEDIWSAKIM